MAFFCGRNSLSSPSGLPLVELVDLSDDEVVPLDSLPPRHRSRTEESIGAFSAFSAESDTVLVREKWIIEWNGEEKRRKGGWVGSWWRGLEKKGKRLILKG